MDVVLCWKVQGVSYTPVLELIVFQQRAEVSCYININRYTYIMRYILSHTIYGIVKAMDHYNPDTINNRV